MVLLTFRKRSWLVVRSENDSRGQSRQGCEIQREGGISHADFMALVGMTGSTFRFALVAQSSRGRQRSLKQIALLPTARSDQMRQ